MAAYGKVHYYDRNGEIGVGIWCETKAAYENELREGADWVEAHPSDRSLWGEILPKTPIRPLPPRDQEDEADLSDFDLEYQSTNRFLRHKES